MFEILYEDNHIIVVKKEQNVLVQGDETHDECLLDEIKKYIKDKYQKPGNVFVGLVHRLDRPTGGVMVFAKTSKAASRLSDQIRNGEMKKRYLCVCNKIPRDEYSELTHYLKKDEKTNTVYVAPRFETGAKEAKLIYKVLDKNGNHSLLDIDLITGRSHQIRVQLATIGCPLVGDMKYNKNQSANECYLALWAYSLNFIHPTSKQSMTFYCLPNGENYPWNEFNLSNILPKFN